MSSKEVDELHRLLDDSDSHLLFTVVSSAGCHNHVHESLNNGALSLLESPLLVAALSVGDVNLLSDSRNLKVVFERHIRALYSLIGPNTEELRLQREFGYCNFFNNGIVVVV